jgi:hypothetical protein
MEQKHSSRWAIPRPSLSSNSSSNTNKSHDGFYNRKSEVIDVERSKEKKHSAAVATISSSSSSSISSHRHHQINETCVDDEGAKRGSRSSQGSSDSEQSIHVSSIYLIFIKFIVKLIFHPIRVPRRFY